MKVFTRLLLLTGVLSMSAFMAVGQAFNGYALYNELNANTAYLIDKDGNIAHSWSCSVSCNYTVLLKENGNIIRGGKYSGNQLNGAAVGGMVQEIDPTGAIVWEFIYSTSDHVSHHDITLMPNGNVLLTAWEAKTGAELAAAGWSGSTNSDKWPTHFVEVQQNGTGGQIVWEWHIWDHMVQDYDNGKPNYGVIADHPELMDINLSTGGGGPPGSGDWFHVNGVHYNATLDQIVFSSRFLSEIYIIDHSTTTAEAATHSGGNAGKGGDFLYRWGNPANYDAPGSQEIAAAVHDVRWIEDDGRPNGGYIQFFNNEGGSGGSSAVDAIDPPFNGVDYDLTPGQAYGPSARDWRHDCLDDASGQSASNRMSNGNTFVCVSQTYIYEVDSLDNLVWQYNAQPAKAFRYECDYPGIIALLGNDPCGIGVGISENELAQIEIAPNPSTGVFNINGITLGETNVSIVVFDIYGNRIDEVQNQTSIDLSEHANGMYIVTMNFDDTQSITKKISLIR
jgi:hypothetical protein